LKNILYDGIITSLQSSGGVSVYFKELVSRKKVGEYIWVGNEAIAFDVSFEKYSNRLLERYRACQVNEYLGLHDIGLFHSSYYRLPNIPIPVITTVHDFTYERYSRGYSSYVHTWQKNKAIQGSHAIICVSQSTANDLLEYCPVSEDRISIVYNGVSNVYSPISLLESNFEKNNVLFVGARGGYKNFNSAVLAISKTKNLCLTAVGGGAFTKYELEFLEANIPRRYSWLGRLSDEELNFAYNTAYCLLYPSSYEGFGIPILESMRAGCPVIAVNCSSIPEVAGGAALLVDDPSPSVLVEALNTLNYNFERDKFIEKGFKQASLFSWDKCYNETQIAYKKLL
jgi:mannosyltransferase